MSTLHIVNKSPFRTDALQRSLQLVAPGDSIILIEDGVLGVNLPALATSATNISFSCYALSEDLAARSLTIETDVLATDVAGFVALVCEHRNCVSYG